MNELKLVPITRRAYDVVFVVPGSEDEIVAHAWKTRRNRYNVYSTAPPGTAIETIAEDVDEAGALRAVRNRYFRSVKTFAKVWNLAYDFVQPEHCEVITDHVYGVDDDDEIEILFRDWDGGMTVQQIVHEIERLTGVPG